MSSQLKGGKRPSSQRAKQAPIMADDLFMNPLGLDPEMIKLIEEKGHVARFINAVQYKRFGHHPAHWRPISRKQLKEWGYATIDAHDFTDGSSADGYIYRGQDLILATRPRAINDKHKAYLKQEATRTSVRNMQAQTAAAIRENSRHEGLQVHEGYHTSMDEKAFNETDDSEADEA